jgi:dihydroorotase/N-acyl-D-amino-acid deacylase
MDLKPLLLSGGTIADGTGAPLSAGDLLIRGGVIAGLGEFAAPEDAEAIDCTGLTIAPGFIDGHGHSDLQVLENRPEKLLQGVTTEVVGNCGFSPYPAREDRGPLHEFADGIFCGGGNWGWPTAADYLRDARRFSRAGVVSLLGHGTLRVWAAGHRLGALSGREADCMERMLDDALAEGAAGFSTGLMYSPGASAPFEELERLCRVVARRGKTYATHMRDYSDRLVEAVEEQLELARRTGCRLQISHLQAVGERNWPLQQIALDRIEEAGRQGVDVAFDCYPYTRGSTVLTQLLPQWALEGGIEGLLAGLADPPRRARIAAETEAALAQGWHGIIVAAVATGGNQRQVGRTIAAIALDRGRPPVETALDLLAEERGKVNILELNQSEANLRQTLSHPLSNVISDGFYTTGRAHPRLHGTFPLLLGEICRERKWLSLPEAIRKITEAPANRFGIARRGRLAPGWQADIVVFDSRTIDSAATYEVPEHPPSGIEYVFGDGCLLVKGSKMVFKI